uniref:NADH-ubiquinone oxidoreductase chain 4 n=1 Tax=Arion vulgaris TaxID=1028688 RepID=A0A6C0AA60_9EUPU|nr:NADH dehydrogenase subunit 4 [Arion vulgaris]QHS71057.1 NADH dehydrogenase subunit 4 [Arion vulgaris]
MWYRHWEIVICSLIWTLLYASMSLSSCFNYQEGFMTAHSNLGMMLILLAVLISLLSLLLSVSDKNMTYRNTILALTLVMILCFSTHNLFYFYIFFEVSLIPILYIIISWGYQPERLQAGTYLMLYTVCASLPLLVSIFLIYNTYGTLNYFMIKTSNISVDHWLTYISLLMALMVKMPIYVGHLWLPKAHVEAPLAGSMILAGLLLKLGGYGLFMMFYLFEFSCMSVNMFFISVSLWGGLLAGMICLSQVDMKSFVAYTSVAHMSLVLAALLMNNLWGVMAAKITIIAHGYTSSLMFALAAISYLKSSSRSLITNKGLLVFYPVISLMWFLSLILCMAAPPSLNLLGELMFVPSFSDLSYLLVVVLGLMMFLSAVYSMYLYTSLCHGVSSKLLGPNVEWSSANLLGILLHFVPLLLIFNMHYFMVYYVGGYMYNSKSQ